MFINALSANNNVAFARRNSSNKPRLGQPKECSQCGNPNHGKGGSGTGGVKK